MQSSETCGRIARMSVFSNFFTKLNVSHNNAV